MRTGYQEHILSHLLSKAMCLICRKPIFARSEIAINRGVAAGRLDRRIARVLPSNKKDLNENSRLHVDGGGLNRVGMCD